MIRDVLDRTWTEEDVDEDGHDVPAMHFFEGDEGTSGTYVGLAHATWHEMGEPERITVTVEPSNGPT